MAMLAAVPARVTAYDAGFVVANARVLIDLHPHIEPNANGRVPNWLGRDTISFVWHVQPTGAANDDTIACSCPDCMFNLAVPKPARRQCPRDSPFGDTFAAQSPRIDRVRCD